MSEIITEIRHAGQEFLDEPVFVAPKQRSELDRIFAAAFKQPPLPQPIQVGHERVRLQWMKPDGKGGLVPKRTNTPKESRI